MKAFWVGVIKGRWTGHRVLEFDGDPDDKDAPDCDYVIGPYADKTEAEEKAAIEENGTGMFHPFPGDPR